MEDLEVPLLVAHCLPKPEDKLLPVGKQHSPPATSRRYQLGLSNPSALVETQVGWASYLGMINPKLLLASEWVSLNYKCKFKRKMTLLMERVASGDQWKGQFVLFCLGKQRLLCYLCWRNIFLHNDKDIMWRFCPAMVGPLVCLKGFRNILQGDQWTWTCSKNTGVHFIKQNKHNVYNTYKYWYIYIYMYINNQNQIYYS